MIDAEWMHRHWLLFSAWLVEEQPELYLSICEKTRRVDAQTTDPDERFTLLMASYTPDERMALAAASEYATAELRDVSFDKRS